MRDDIKKIGLALIRGNKLLILRNTGTDLFLMPGGRVEENEEPLETLEREIKEELGCNLVIESTRYLGDFKDWAANDPGRQVVIKLFKGEVDGIIKIGSEIEELRWYDPNIDKPEILSAIIKNKILPFLINQEILTKKQ